MFSAITGSKKWTGPLWGRINLRKRISESHKLPVFYANLIRCSIVFTEIKGRELFFGITQYYVVHCRYIRMKNSIFFALLTALLLICLQAESEVYEPDKLRVHLRLDKKVFYSDEAVILQIFVKNISEKKNFFEVYDTSDAESGKYVSFQPLVFDMRGREAGLTVLYKLENRDINDVIRGLDKRLVELAPGEIFIHSIDLKDIYQLNLGTPYRLKSLFYPAFDGAGAIKSDNELSFKIIEEKRYNKPDQVEAFNRNISPQEIVILILNAEKNKNWDNFLKYVHVEKYINAYPEFVQRYIKANFDEKYRIEREFIKYITRDRDDYLLDFKIIKEEIENSKKLAYVDVVEDRFGSRWNYRYRYRYILEFYKNMWLITDEEVTYLKGVKR